MCDGLTDFLRPFLNPHHWRHLIPFACFLFGSCSLASLKALSRPAKWLSWTSWNPVTLHDLQFHFMNQYALNLDVATNHRSAHVIGEYGCQCETGRNCMWGQLCYGPVAHSFIFWQLLLHKQVITVCTWVTKTQITTIPCRGMKHSFDKHGAPWPESG